MLSAVLFIIYTTNCRGIFKHDIIKYADDTVIVGMISNDEDVDTYADKINHFVKWHDKNSSVIISQGVSLSLRRNPSLHAFHNLLSFAM